MKKKHSRTVQRARADNLFNLFTARQDRAQKPPDMRTRALATVSCIPAVGFSKWRRTNQNLTRHSGRCQAAVLALRIFQHR